MSKRRPTGPGVAVAHARSFTRLPKVPFNSSCSSLGASQKMGQQPNSALHLLPYARRSQRSDARLYVRVNAEGARVQAIPHVQRGSHVGHRQLLGNKSGHSRLGTRRFCGSPPRPRTSPSTPPPPPTPLPVGIGQNKNMYCNMSMKINEPKKEPRSVVEFCLPTLFIRFLRYLAVFFHTHKRMHVVCHELDDAPVLRCAHCERVV
jgi:hypothetical protein